jgi:hypothetical protein
MLPHVLEQERQVILVTLAGTQVAQGLRDGGC